MLLVLLLKSADKTDRKSEEKTPSALELELTMIRYDVPVVAACKSRHNYGSGLGKREATMPLVKGSIQQGTPTDCRQRFVKSCTCELHVRTLQTSSLSS